MEEEPKTHSVANEQKELQTKTIFGQQGWDYITKQGL